MVLSILVLASDLRCVESVKAHKDAVNVVTVSKDGTVTGFVDKRIRVWAKLFSTPSGFEKSIFFVFSSQESRVEKEMLDFHFNGILVILIIG